MQIVKASIDHEGKGSVTELGANLLLSEEIKQTLGILPRIRSKGEVPQYFGQVEEVSAYGPG